MAYCSQSCGYLVQRLVLERPLLYFVDKSEPAAGLEIIPGKTMDSDVFSSPTIRMINGHAARGMSEISMCSNAATVIPERTEMNPCNIRNISIQFATPLHGKY